MTLDAGSERLRQLCDTVEAEMRHLRLTDEGLFIQPFTAERVQALTVNHMESERVDAFAARFDAAGRLVAEARGRLI